MSSQLLVGFLLVIKEKGCNSRIGCAGLGKAALPVAGGGICRDLRIAKQASSGSAVCGNTRSMRCRCLVPNVFLQATLLCKLFTTFFTCKSSTPFNVVPLLDFDKCLFFCKCAFSSHCFVQIFYPTFHI